MVYEMFIGNNIYYLITGEIFFSHQPIKIQTTLGSCVAVTVWNPEKRYGGMCHFLLPYSSKKEAEKPDGFYGVHAVRYMKGRMEKEGNARDYQVGLYGGGSLFFSPDKTRNVGCKNIQLAEQWVKQEKLNVVETSLGGDNARTLVMDLENGKIDVRLYPVPLDGNRQ